MSGSKHRFQEGCTYRSLGPKLKASGDVVLRVSENGTTGTPYRKPQEDSRIIKGIYLPGSLHSTHVPTVSLGSVRGPSAFPVSPEPSSFSHV